MHNPNIVFTSPRVAEVLDRPVPSPGPGDVLVRTVRSCLSDGTERGNLGDTFGETDGMMRGPHLHVLQKLGIFRNRLTRDGDGNLSDYPMTDAEKREVEQRMRYCGLLPEEEK